MAPAEEKTGGPEEPVRSFPKALLPLGLGAAAGLLSYGARSAGAGIGLLMLGFFLLRPLALRFRVKLEGGREWAGALWFTFLMWFLAWSGMRMLFG